MIYGGLTTIDESYSNFSNFDVNEMMEDDNIVAAPEENLHEATFRIVNEMEYNWARINEAACLDELSAFAESGEIDVVTEASFGFFEKAKEFFRKLWAKIQEIFKNVLMYFNTKFGSNDAFYRKYKTALNKAVNAKSFENMKFTGYKFDGLENKVLTGSGDTLGNVFKDFQAVASMKAKVMAIDSNNNTLAELKEEIQSNYTEEKKKDALNEHRKELFNHITGESANSDLTDKEFKSELEEFLKGSASKEQLDVDGTMISTAFGFLKGIDRTKSLVEKSLRTIKQSIDSDIRTVDEIQKRLSKENAKDTKDENQIAGRKAQIANWHIDLMKSAKLVATTACGIITSNIKQYAAQARMLAAKAITYNSKKFEESTMFGGSLVNSVELI